MKILPTWIKLPYFPLPYWGQCALNKIIGAIRKPIRTDWVTTQKDILDEYARLLVKVSLDQEFPNEVVFCNEKGKLQS